MLQPLYKHLFTSFTFFLTGIAVFAQSIPSDSSRLTNRVFQLGEVQIIGIGRSDSSNSVSFRQIEAFNRLDVGQAISLLPGVNLATVGPRNESVVFVRGFDLRQVPVFIDGIPLYVPYDGYVDLGRFTTFDLSEINVAKGFSSVTYGANTLGGAINLVSRRPLKKLEYDFRSSLMSGSGHRVNLNLGTNLGKFYIQGGISELKQDTYPLSDKFKARKYEDGDDRENAYRQDRKYSVKVGFTPNATDEYAISYINQQGEKGTPSYVGNDSKQTARFWQWPYWNKESLYFVSNTALNEHSYIKARLYYDNFSNALYAYDDSTYTTQKKGSSFKSFYKDDTYGASAEYGIRVGEMHTVKAAVQYKQDHHRENNAGEPVRNFKDQTYSVGIEDAIRVGSHFTILPGISLNGRKSLEAQNYNSSTKEITDFASNDNIAFNAQAGVAYAVAPAQKINLSLARKTRFPTIKDRYSYRLGSAIPTPDLKPENAMHYEAGYTSVFKSRFRLEASAFLSQITDAIQQVNNVQPNVYQLQNTGKARFYGGDFSASYTFFSSLQAGGQYNYIHRENQNNPDFKFTDVPEHKVLVFAQYSYKQKASITGNFEHNSSRYSTSYGTRAAGFNLVNVKASAKVFRVISLEGGVNNIFDVNYALAEGFPQPGRNYFVNLVINNL